MDVAARVTQWTNAWSESYAYDGCGALTNLAAGCGLALSLAYDALGRPVSALATNGQAASGGLLSFAYDALGNRVRTSADGTNRFWSADHSDPLTRPLVEADTNGAAVRYYVWGAGRLLGVADASGALLCAHCDDSGSVVALTDAGGAAVFTANYGPYGEEWGSSGTNATPFRWLGGLGVQRVLPTAYSLQPSVFPCPLYLTRHRLYSAPLHRFLSADPLGPDGGINLYAYASGNPLAYVDPLGLCGQSLDLPDVSQYGILSVLAPATLTGSTAYEDHYSSYTLPMLQTIADGLATETAVANVQQGMVDAFAENALISTETDTVVAEEVAAKSGIGVTGEIGENALKQLGGESQVFFNTTQGKRYVDQFVNGMANESKVGYQSLTPSIRLQVMKDVELMETGDIKGSIWNFYRSPVTGKIGPSEPLCNFLNQNNIPVVLHY